MRLERGTSPSSTAPAPGSVSNNGIANGTVSKLEAQSNGISGGRNGAVAKLEAGGSPRVARGDYFGHDREEVTRLLIQALKDLGYHKAASSLEEESEYTLESSYVSSFRQAVLKGEWGKAEQLLYGMEIHQDADFNALLFYLRQQKFLELLEKRDVSRALQVLRAELTPLNHSIEKLHFLSSLMLCLSAEDLKQQAGWDGARGNSRQYLLSELSKFISPSIMLPGHRLASLLQQVKDTQLFNCTYHDSTNPLTLYADHQCDKSLFPRTTVELLSDHTDEVYCVKFSNDGQRLASSSNDKTIIIWDVETFEHLAPLTGHTKGVAYVEWSPDDSRLVSCARDNTARIWDSQTGACLKTLKEFMEPVCSVAWHPDGQSFITGALDEHMIQWSRDGEKLQKISAPRTYDLKVTPDGKKLVVVDTDRAIHVYDLDEWKNERIYNMNAELTYVQISKDSRHAMVNTLAQEVRLIDLETGKIVQRYKGYVQKQWLIRGCFGGHDEYFVMSGSEDSNLFIWHRQGGHLVEQLAGHTGTINCVTWNPVLPHMFASAGDDRTIRIWSRGRQQQVKGKMKSPLDNGIC